MTVSKIATSKFHDHIILFTVPQTATQCMLELSRYIEQQSMELINNLTVFERDKLKRIKRFLLVIVAIKLCGHRNVSPKGHRDDSQHKSDSSIYPGNVLEILKYGNKYECQQSVQIKRN